MFIVLFYGLASLLSLTILTVEGKIQLEEKEAWQQYQLRQEGKNSYSNIITGVFKCRFAFLSWRYFLKVILTRFRDRVQLIILNLMIDTAL